MTTDPARPSASAGALSLELGDVLLQGLDAFAASEGDAPSRAEAARRILHEALREKGYLRFHEHEEGTRPQDLSSANDG